MVSVTGIIEVGVQILTSLLAGVIIAIPIIFIYQVIVNRKIKNKAKHFMDNDLTENEKNKLKGGYIEHAKNERFAEEKRVGTIADSKFLRKYTNDKYINGDYSYKPNESIGDSVAGKDKESGRRTEASVIKGELSDTSHKPVSGNEPDLKRNWFKFD